MSSDLKKPLLHDMNIASYFQHDHTPQHRVLKVFDDSEQDPIKKQKLDAQYPANVIVSSRYTIINFLPKSLLEQFRRLANVYFLVIGIIAAVGSVTSYYETAVEPAGILAPMVIVVLISVIKDGIEDFKRHQADNRINNRLTHGLLPDGTIVDKKWKDIKVGDVLVVMADEELPADVLVLMCGGVSGQFGYVETAAIDGETNLKLKYPALTAIHRANGSQSDLAFSSDHGKILGTLSSIKCKVTAEPPNSSIHRFNGIIEPHDDGYVSESTKQVSLSEKNLMLRGSVLRATEWCVCSAVYTGADTKLSLNSKRPPSKLSSVDRIVNRTLAIAITVMIFVCIVSMIFGIVWYINDSNASYLCLKSDQLSSEYPDGGGCENGYPSSYLTIFTFATLYNNFVCISMYVSLEMVYICQSFFLCSDLQLYDESTDTPAECSSSGMCADLGQVQYVLSDKTGTLTKNQMIVQCMSIGKRVYGTFASDDDADGESAPLGGRQADTEFYTTMAHVQTVGRAGQSANGSAPMSEPEKLLILQFMRVLVYCNTAMIMPGEGGTEEVQNNEELVDRLQAESPDEVALVQCASEHCGVLLKKRSNHEIVSEGLNKYSVSGEGSSAEERVELLAVNEFDSDRKMMSVVVKVSTTGKDKQVTHKNLLLCKGADSSILRHCKDLSQGPYTDYCKAHINMFASTGLRTLALSYREVSEGELETWMKEYNAASNNITGRAEAMAKVAQQIEQNMILIGALGIEDELQDGVPEAIRIMHSAGINVWMITGDKAETAIAIGKKCALVQPGKNHIERVLSLSNEALRQRIMDLHSYVLSRRDNNTAAPKTSGLEDTSIEVLSRTSTNNSNTAAKAEATTRLSMAEPQGDGELALIVDGISLEGVWLADDLKVKFIEIVQFVPIVIACRVSPLQKAALVRMVKSAPGSPVTLSIGDGANDVGMIHESRVGVGISGKEGRHAANAADFAISQFRFITHLLFSHGRYNYIRCSKLVLYSFFKNLLLVSVLFYFCTYSGFSGTIPLDSIVFSGYNFYLGLPVLALGAMDFDIPRSVILKFPYEAYATGRLGEMLNMKNMSKWCIFAFVQGLLLFVVATRFVSGPTFVLPSDGYFSFDIYGTGLNQTSSGSELGIYSGGLLLYTCIIFAMQYKVVAMSVTPNYIFWAVWMLSFIGYFFFLYCYGLFPTLDWFNTAPLALNQPLYWLALIVVPFLLVISDYMVDVFWEKIDPSSRDLLVRKLREAEKMGCNKEEEEELRNSTASGHSGIALSNCFSSQGSTTSKQEGHRPRPPPPPPSTSNPLSAEEKI